MLKSCPSVLKAHFLNIILILTFLEPDHIHKNIRKALLNETKDPFSFMHLNVAHHMPQKVHKATRDLHPVATPWHQTTTSKTWRLCAVIASCVMFDGSIFYNPSNPRPGAISTSCCKEFHILTVRCLARPWGWWLMARGNLWMEAVDGLNPLAVFCSK